MSINANNTALNEILETINNLPSVDGSGGGMVYTNIVYNDDNTVTLTDKDGVDHIMVCEYTDGVLSGLTYDGKSVELTYEEDTLVNIGTIEVDMANAPIESGGGGTEENVKGIIFSDFTDKYQPQVIDISSIPQAASVYSSNFPMSFRCGAGGTGYFSELRELKLGKVLTIVPRELCAYCLKLNNVYGDMSNISTVSYMGFSDCHSLSEFPYMPNLKTIEQWGFYGCKSLTEVKFPETIKTIHGTAFEDCNNLINIYCPWAEGAVDNAPWGATNVKKIYYEVSYDEYGNPCDKEGKPIVPEEV